MTRKELIQYLVAIILGTKKNSPILVGIDGVDASGKTTLANELADELADLGKAVVRASIDGFHNPRKIRYAKGNDSPRGYYLDSFDNQCLIDILLTPLSAKGDLKYKTVAFDFLTNKTVSVPVKTARRDSILVMEGVFLFRPELAKYWDIKIFLDGDFSVTVPRAMKRVMEKHYLGTKQAIIDRYSKRYIPGQELYFADANPKEKADIIIDNNDFLKPVIKKGVALAK